MTYPMPAIADGRNAGQSNARESKIRLTLPPLLSRMNAQVPTCAHLRPESPRQRNSGFVLFAPLVFYVVIVLLSSVK